MPDPPANVSSSNNHRSSIASLQDDPNEARLLGQLSELPEIDEAGYASLIITPSRPMLTLPGGGGGDGGLTVLPADHGRQRPKADADEQSYYENTGGYPPDLISSSNNVAAGDAEVVGSPEVLDANYAQIDK